ncbi:hypothetical protein HYZ80_02365 [Candidatus Parcubacteria bacterium]|nr:hypothetical protein [Candidatus Parcubacteria bacterium]
MERMAKLAAPRKGRLEAGKPSVIIRVLDLVQLHQAEQGGHCIEYRRLRFLARQHDPQLLERGRIGWGLWFLVRQGHLRRVKHQLYQIIE